jgi:hypothetical protein
MKNNTSTSFGEPSIIKTSKNTIIPVVIKKDGSFFSAGDISLYEFYRIKTSKKLEVYKSTPLRVEIVRKYLIKGIHPKCTPFISTSTQTATPKPSYYTIRGFELGRDMMGRNIIRQTVRLERESSRLRLTNALR